MALIICSECGRGISDKATACPHCGAPLPGTRAPQPMQQPQAIIKCPKCGSTSIDSQVFQENLGSTTVTKTKSKYKQVGHGCIWWLTIGWWWWFIDLCLWVSFFIPRLLFQLFRKKNYKGSSASVSSTKKKIVYKTVFLCKSCGERWVK